MINIKVIILIIFVNLQICHAQSKIDSTSISKNDQLFVDNNNNNDHINQLDNKLDRIIQKLNNTTKWQIFIPAVMAFLTAIAVTFLTTIFNRQNEIKKNIFIHRLDIFDIFLHELDTFFQKSFGLILKATQYRKEHDQPDQESLNEISNIFYPVRIRSISISLLINRKDKEIFDKLIQTIIKKVIASCIDHSEYPYNIEKEIIDIKDILEINLREVQL